MKSPTEARQEIAALRQDAQFSKAYMDGKAPVARGLFYASKYAIVILWVTMVVQSWGINLSPIKGPAVLHWMALGLWASGFFLLFLGRFGLGDSFRIGSPKEVTHLQTDGLFRFSRNPMYVGVYATILASVLYTLNPVPFLIGVFVVAVHHRIVLAEEEHLRSVFGDAYIDYCHHVRRYL